MSSVVFHHSSSEPLNHPRVFNPFLKFMIHQLRAPGETCKWPLWAKEADVARSDCAAQQNRCLYSGLMEQRDANESVSVLM